MPRLTGTSSSLKLFDRLFDLILKDLEVLLYETGHQAIIRIGHRHRQRHDLVCSLTLDLDLKLLLRRPRRFCS